MTVVKCLFLEHDPIDLADFSYSIKSAWDTIGTGLVLEIEHVSDWTEVEPRVASGDIHLLVADLMFPRGDYGLGAIQIARRRQAGLAIIALSGADRDLERKALDYGADKFVPKQWLQDSSDMQGFGVIIRDVMETKGHLTIGASEDIVHFEQRNYAVRSVVESIGRSNIARLAQGLLPGYALTKIDASYVTAGFSGAQVVRLTCYGEQPEKFSRQLLLKCARDQELILREYRKREEAELFPEGLFVTFLKSVPASSGGWFAIGSFFAEEAITFNTALASNNRGAKWVIASMQSLFAGTHGLCSTYRRTSKFNDQADIVSGMTEMLTVARRARALRYLHEFESLVVAHDASKVCQPETLKLFLEEGRLDGLRVSKVPLGLEYSLCHGDLHTGNVLVSDESRMRLIDPANIERLPWCADIARFFVDLIVAVLDSGSRSYEWESLSDWLDVIDALLKLPFSAAIPPTIQRNDSISAAAWIRSNLRVLAPNPSHNCEAEFLLAVLVEFLRASWRLDITAPKRVLSLLGASIALNRVKDAIGNS